MTETAAENWRDESRACPTRPLAAGLPAGRTGCPKKRVRAVVEAMA